LNQHLEQSFIETISGSLEYHRPKRSLVATNDSANASANMAVLFETKPVDTGGDLVGFADGHVEFVKDTGRLRELRAAVREAESQP